MAWLLRSRMSLLSMSSKDGANNLCFINALQTGIHVEPNKPKKMAPFQSGPEGYWAECEHARLHDVVHFVLESLVDGTTPAADCVTAASIASCCVLLC